MSEQAKQSIMARLKKPPQEIRTVELPPAVAKKQSQQERVAQLQEMMEKVRVEIHHAQPTDLIEQLSEIANKKKIQALLYAPDTVLGKNIHQEWPVEKRPLLVPYDQEIETFKEALFQVDASVTTTLGGIAETGTLVLSPTAEEPRAMSLVPPVHIAVLEAKQIHHNFQEMMLKEGWTEDMPTNLLLISGPSKTGDIEFSLQYGVHGPKELVVILLEEN